MHVCQDCLIAAVNNDYTGMPRDVQKAVSIGLVRTGPLHCVYKPESEDNHAGFSWQQCECCLSTLGGDRYEMERSMTFVDQLNAEIAKLRDELAYMRAAANNHKRAVRILMGATPEEVADMRDAQDDYNQSLYKED